MRTLTAMIVTMLLLPATAAAKSGIVLSPSPDGDTVRIKKQGSGESHTFQARRQPNGAWPANVGFPSNGTWTYLVSGMESLGAHQSWDPVTVPRSATTGGESGSHTSDGAFPIGWIGAASPILIALGLWFER